MPESPKHPLVFTPVAARARRDGWTPQRQRDFIAALAQLGLAAAAARSVGMSPKSAYALRNRAGADGEFAAAWDAAVALGRAHALATGIERALRGTAIPVFYRGRQIGERRHYNDSLLLAAIRAIDPKARAAMPEPDSEWRF